MTTEDSREHSRFGPLLIRAECWHGKKTIEGYLLNLSRGGAYMATNSDLANGDIVRLLISLPWKLGEVRTEAKVIWRSAGSPKVQETDLPDGVGLAFTHLDKRAGEKLQLYMNRFSQLAALIEETV